ncbi:MAG: hypothetical protein KGO82_14785, partial [Bacteroidota bacterium]|nr:hypothetical protein [Bacteroidota bacterium]
MPDPNDVVEVASYRFSPWARKGIAASIIETDDLGAGTATQAGRARVPVGVKLNDTALTKQFSLIGPGDIIGVNSDMIVRTDPVNRVTSTESNYLVSIEFYDEDFAWRYTPAAPSGDHLRPWLFLLVLKETEFERSKQRVPLPVITVKVKEALPPANETWLWAHVHCDADIPDSELSTLEKFLISINKNIGEDPDQLYCRLMSPRKLEPNTGYYAFLVPAFETGRVVGLKPDADISAIPAQKSAWTEAGTNGDMPVYYEWHFRTGDEGDFESLVKLLNPNPMDKRVGIRDMDCHQPGFMRADDPSLPLAGTEPTLLGLEGALKSPTAVSTTFPDPDKPNLFQPQLQAIVNLPRTMQADLTKDPIISAPLYGGNHAKKSATEVVMLDVTSNSWVNDLNRDPRTRVPAGFGTRVIQENQESLMQKAWNQVMKIVEANKLIQATVFNIKIAMKYSEKTLSRLSAASLISVSKPVLSRIMGSPTTLLHQLNESILPAALFSGTYRRIVRPGGRVSKKLKGIRHDEVVNLVNEGKISAEPPKQTPAALPDTQKLANEIKPKNISGWLSWIIKNSLLVLLILLLLFLVLAILTGMYILFVLLAGAAAFGYQRLAGLRKDYHTADLLADPKQLQQAIAAAPPQPSFQLQLSDEPALPAPVPAPAGQDSYEAKRFRRASADLSSRMSLTIDEKKWQPFNIGNAQEKLLTALRPSLSFSKRLYGTVILPEYIQPEKIFPAMAYPDFEDPMYKKLADISSELLLPNVKLIPPNTISLLRTNQKFIEAYMVGLNHEMGRELLWREYPTDERGSYFRQFWDVKGIVRPATNKTEAQTNEEFKDIKPIHTWPVTSLLGKHNNRDAQGDANQTVLVIRGELLNHYPNTV